MPTRWRASSRQRELRRHLGGHGPVGVAHDGVEERLLALHVEVERPLGDAHPRGHIGHLGAPVALLEEDGRRCLDQVVEALGRDATGHTKQLT